MSRALLAVAAAVLLVGCGGDEPTGDTMRRTPQSEACRLLNSGVPWPSIAPKLVDEFWPNGPTEHGERPDVLAAIAVSNARGQGCGQ